MKIEPILLGSVILIGRLAAFGQGTVVYDQQSSTEANVLEGFLNIQINEPFGQSFTPSLNAVGFIRLGMLTDAAHTGASEH